MPIMRFSPHALALRYTGPRLDACYGQSTTVKAGYFVCNGSAGTGTVNMAETGFYTSAIYQPYSLPSPPNRF